MAASIARKNVLLILRAGLQYLPDCEGHAMRTGLSVVVASATLVTVVLGDAANAQTQRQRHLPYIRAASDCIANAVKRDYAFADAVQTDNFKHLVNGKSPF